MGGGAKECPSIALHGTSYGNYIKVFSRGDITLHNLEINSGTCAHNESFFRTSGLELKLGEKIIISISCSVDDIKEVKLKTNIGDCKLSKYI